MTNRVKLLKQILKLARKKAGLSQSELADKLGVTKAYISNLESLWVTSTTETPLFSALDVLGLDVMTDLEEIINSLQK